MFLTHVDVWVEELGPGIAGQHVDDDDLPPLLHVNQEVTQLPVILVDQVDALWTNLLKRHNDAACHQLRHIFIYITGGVIRKMFLEPGGLESTCCIWDLLPLNCTWRSKWFWAFAKIARGEEERSYKWYTLKELRHWMQSGAVHMCCTAWFSDSYLHLLTWTNTGSMVHTPTVVLSARSFSMTSISWSFCSGSKLWEKKRVNDKTRNVGLRVSIYLSPKKKNLLLRIKQIILQPGK